MSEIRIKRAKFTKVLQEMCAALDHSSRKSVSWKSHYSDEIFNSEVEVLSLWVAGSYSRGALECGDLDLVMEYTSGQPRSPSIQMVRRAFFKNYQRVGIFEGTPSDNDSGIELSGTILVWQGKGFDWQTAIANIKEDPHAGHHSRKSDAIPLRPLQLGMHIEDVEALVDMQEKEQIGWQFTPIAELSLKEPKDEDEVYLKRLMSFAGLKTQKLFPYLLAYFKTQEVQPHIVLRHDFTKNRYAINGAQILVGNPIVPIQLLDEVTTSELVILPHLSRRGPNGVWSIVRGQNHPLTLASSQFYGYCFADESNKPSITIMAKDILCPAWRAARILELFSTEEEAERFAEELAEDEIYYSKIIKVQGKALLNLISYLDVVRIDNTQFALTYTGRNMSMESEITSTYELLLVLEKMMP